MDNNVLHEKNNVLLSHVLLIKPEWQLTRKRHLRASLSWALSPGPSPFWAKNKRKNR